MSSVCLSIGSIISGIVMFIVYYVWCLICLIISCLAFVVAGTSHPNEIMKWASEWIVSKWLIKELCFWVSKWVSDKATKREALLPGKSFFSVYHLTSTVAIQRTPKANFQKSEFCMFDWLSRGIFGPRGVLGKENFSNFGDEIDLQKFFLP